MKDVELAVVGGGPAGLSAAIEAARAGVQVAVFDENPSPGGQIYRQLPAAFGVAEPGRLGKDHREGQALLNSMAGLPVELVLESLVWGIFPERVLAVAHGERSTEIQAGAIVLAVGAYDRPVPFPGWTLPGVLTAGGAQVLVKSQQVLPGRRVLLAGTGPLQLVVATQLARAGAEVIAILEASSARPRLSDLPRLWGQWGLLSEGLGYLREIRRARIPLLRSHTIVHALGREEVEGAVIARVDRQWRPIPGTERTFPVDTIAIGFGFVPSAELPRLAGCAHAYAPELGGWIPRVDEHQETSTPGIFAAGDGAGVAGVLVARAEGKLAGIWAAHRLGRLGDGEAARRAQPALSALRSLRRFRSVLDRLSLPGPGLGDLVGDETVICRCEEVTAAEVRAAIADGAANLNELKAWTRVAMGLCQGRICGPPLMHMLARATGKSQAEILPFSPRPPVKPIPLPALASLASPSSTAS